MPDLLGAGLAKDYCNEVKPVRPVVYIVGCEKITGSPGQSGLLGGGDGRLGGLESFGGFGFYLDENDSTVGIGHNQIDLACLAGEVVGEGFEAFSFEEFFGAFFAPSAEELSVG